MFEDDGSAQDVSLLPVDTGLNVESYAVQRSVKGEDLVFSYRADVALLGRTMPCSQPDDPEQWKLNYDVFVLADGHAGTKAIEFLRDNFLRVLNPLMPSTLPVSFASSTGTTYAAEVRVALARTFETLNSNFASRRSAGGCTLTVCIITGRLISVASLGDSDALVDAFSQAIAMTIPHRVNDNEEERARVVGTGALIAPLSVNMNGPAQGTNPGLGPLRIWPGGLCVSRSLGDTDVGECVLAKPHVRQLLVPAWGCRVVLATDGVWDSISNRQVLKAVKGRACLAAAENVVKKCLHVHQGELVDDTTAVLIDCRPFNVASFKDYNPVASAKEGSLTLTTPGRGSSPSTADNNNTSPGGGGALFSECEVSALYVATTKSEPRSNQAGAVVKIETSPAPKAPTTPNVGEFRPQQVKRSAGEVGHKWTASTVKDNGKADKQRGRLFMCCMTAPMQHSSDGDEENGELKNGKSLNALDEEVLNNSSVNASVHSNPSMHGSAADNGSIRKGLSKMGIGRNQSGAGLPHISLYADCDMAFEHLPLATVSESTADESVVPDHVFTTRGADATSPGRSTKEDLAMEFEPSEIEVERSHAQCQHRGMRPTGGSEYSTRPERTSFTNRITEDINRAPRSMVSELY